MQRLLTSVEPPKEFRLSEYKVPDYLIKHTDVRINLSTQPANVVSRLTIKANSDCKERPKDLVLDGQNLKLKQVTLNNKHLVEHKDYSVSEKSLTIFNVPEECIVETAVEVEDSKDLFGLYKTEGIYLVKAETEGLRKVFFCKDRPDVLSTYTTTIIADPKEYPVLLSNGEITEEVSIEGKQIVKWEDNTPKPSYLFALVAGNLNRLEDKFTTKSGREIGIEFYVKKEAIDKCHFAMAMLKKAMRWDETTYGLECNLTTHRVAGIDKYAAGASEPTGLNLFNTEYLFATPAMKNDSDFIHVADVVSHEYFHYWTGNRATIRDWPNLTLKEGLTSFRADEFLGDTFGEDSTRIQLVKDLRKSSIESKPARPDSYISVRNLYTASAYSKGSEIFRMMRTILGKEVFHASIAQFLRENDGKAATIEALLESLQKTTGKDLSQFLLWFTQAGTPIVDVKEEYNSEIQTYTLKIKQSHPNKNFKPVPIPIKMGLLDAKGQEMTLHLKDFHETAKEVTLSADKEYQEFQFTGVTSRPIPSLNRDYSACIKLNYDYDSEKLLLLMQHDTNMFNRWEAAQQYTIRLFKDCYAEKCKQVPKEFIEILRGLLQDKHINPGILADIISLPSETELATQISNPDLDAVHRVRESLSREIALHLKTEFQQKQTELTRQLADKTHDNEFDIHDASCRRLRNHCLKYLIQADPDNGIKIAMNQFEKSLQTTMTDTTAALEMLATINCPERARALDMFYNQWSIDMNAINYWFKVQASTYSPDTIKNVVALMEHKAFDITNPNKVYALFRPFIANPSGFHAASGEGYNLLADVILKLDKINPQTAASLAGNFVNWDTYDAKHQALMREQLHRLAKIATSSNVQEVLKPAVEKSKNKEDEALYFIQANHVRFMGPKRALDGVFLTEEQRVTYRKV